MVMEIDLGPRARAFREEVRQWLEANRPDFDFPPGGERSLVLSDSTEVKAWADRLYAAGYMCVSWPVEYGGRGLSAVEVAVMNEEFARANVPRLTRGMGESLVGPSIIAHGTPEQKAYFLPRIIDGTDRYCQGFSEPDAGSDLASLRTRGVVDGDEIVITGQKVWTSGATGCNTIFILCRTDPDVPKHKGISYVIAPMTRPDGSPNGIELRPIRQINGAYGFTETFVTEMRAPLFNVIGGLNNGWRVAMTTLGNERGGHATTQHLPFQKQFWKLVDEARHRGVLTDPVVRQQLAWSYTHTEILRFQGLRTLAKLVAGEEIGPEASLNKIFWSEYARDVGAWGMHLRGADGMIRPGIPSGDDEYPIDYWQEEFFRHRASVIWGGTAEVQRNIVAERVLGLPKEPRVDADPGKVSR